MKERLLIFILTLPFLTLAQHTITGKFLPAKNFENIILYKIELNKSNYIAHSKLDSLGNFEIKLDASAKKGIYRITYSVPQNECQFQVIYNGKENIVVNYNDKSGVNFIKSKENTLLQSYSNQASKLKNEIENLYTTTPHDKEVIQNKFKKLRILQGQYEANSTGYIAHNFIKASRTYIPKNYEDYNTYTANLKSHFFDHIDFNNIYLQTSDLLNAYTANYVLKNVDSQKNQNHSYQQNIDVLTSKIAASSLQNQRNILSNIMRSLAREKAESSASYLAETYLLNISKKTNDKQLTKALNDYLKLAIGKKAPNFNIDKVANTSNTLYNLKGAKRYIVLFWSSTCSHCLKELPLLNDYLNTLNDNEFKVVAIGLEKEAANWTEEIKKYPKFTHVFGDNKWDNKVAADYAVRSTPSYYVLDKNKNIISKPYGLPQLKEFYEANK